MFVVIANDELFEDPLDRTSPFLFTFGVCHRFGCCSHGSILNSVWKITNNYYNLIQIHIKKKSNCWKKITQDISDQDL